MLTQTYKGKKLYYQLPFVRFYKDRIGSQWSAGEWTELAGNKTHTQLYELVTNRKPHTLDKVGILLKYAVPVSQAPDLTGMKAAVGKLKSNTLHWSIERLLNELVASKLAEHRLQIFKVRTTAKKPLLPYVVRVLDGNLLEVAVPVFFVNKILKSVYKIDPNLCIQ